jgi:predicted permease
MRDTILQDIRFAVRGVYKNPGFLIGATCILALGIGANTAMFSIVSGILLRPLPYTDPGRLVELRETDSRFGSVPGAIFMMDLQDWRAHSTTIAEAASYGNIGKNLYDFAEPERIQTIRSEHSLFHVLGVRALVGRTFREDDPQNVAILSAALWKRRFASDPSCIGRKITLDHAPYTIIGVMAEDFQFPYRASLTDLWIPWDVPMTGRNPRVDFAVARLKPGAGAAATRVELTAMTQRRQQQTRWGAAVTPLDQVVSGNMRKPLLTLLGAVGLVLLIACANVANLLLARSTRRLHEIAVRAALGAGRKRLLQQMLTESLLLGILGGAAGFGLAAILMRIGVHVAGPQIPRSWEIGLDWRVFLFLLVASIATSVAFGLLPALLVSRVDPQTALRGSSNTQSLGSSYSGWTGRWLRDGLVIAEVAMSFVLLVSAGLVFRAFLNLQNRPAGMVTRDVQTLRLAATLRDFPGTGELGRYVQGLEDRVRQIPGVRAAGFIQYLPLQNWGWTAGFSIRGRPADPNAPLQTELRYVTPGYFAALHIPVLRGRTFTQQDATGQPIVIVVNDALARTYFPGEDPVGRATDRGTIIGVVGDVRATGLDRPATPETYYSFAQNAAMTSDAGISLVVNSSTAPVNLIPQIRDAIHRINRYQVVYDIKPMERVIAASLADVSLYTWLIGIFAGLAAILAVSGVYGVVSYAVAVRTREFGVRVALGARGAQILQLVLSHGAVMILLGVMLGVAGTLASARLLGNMVRGVEPAGLGWLVLVGLLLALAGLAACAQPARRAMRVDPNIALKYE